MEEILASIREIMASDPHGGYQSPQITPSESQDQDILDLTSPLPDEIPVLSSPVKSQEPPPFSEEKKENAPSPLSKCILDSLGTDASTPSQPQAFGFDIGTSASKPGNPVEELVRQLLQPLLKEWVDVHLPALVRWTINEQVERIIRQGVGQALPTYDSTPSEKK